MSVAPPETPASLREFAAVLQRVSIPSWVIDDDGFFVWVNDAYVELFGDRRGEHFSAMLPAEHLEQVEREFQRKLDGVPVTEYEIEGLLPDGRRVRMDVSTVRLDQTSFCGAVFGIAVTRARPTTSPRTHLTPRQLEVLQLLGAGASTDQIAAELVVTRQTVRNYVRLILRNLGAHSRLEAVIKARRLGLVAD
jgi:PAS domain S-box-containing protein